MKFKLLLAAIIIAISFMAFPQKAEAIPSVSLNYRSFFSDDGHHEIFTFSWWDIGGIRRIISFRFINGGADYPFVETNLPGFKSVNDDFRLNEINAYIADKKLYFNSEDNVDLRIYNINGELMYEKNNLNSEIIDFNNFANQLLLLKISNDNFNETKKLINN